MKETEIKARSGQPIDWIPCPEGRTKAVVACMANCDHKCDQFWRFFEEIGKSPPEYYNENEIGEKVMRRVVFDCDRCGKKDIDPVLSRYDEKTYPEDKLLDAEARSAMLDNSDYLFTEIGSSFYDIIAILERERQWRHFCDKCFAKVLSSWAGIMEVKKKGGGARNDAVESPTKPPKAAKKTPPKKPAGKKEKPAV